MRFSKSRDHIPTGLMELSAVRRVLYVAFISLPLWAAIHWATLLP